MKKLTWSVINLAPSLLLSNHVLLYISKSEKDTKIKILENFRSLFLSSRNKIIIFRKLKKSNIFSLLWYVNNLVTASSERCIARGEGHWKISILTTTCELLIAIRRTLSVQPFQVYTEVTMRFVLTFFFPLKVTSILFFLAVSPLKNIVMKVTRIKEKNSPHQHLRKCTGNSMENMPTDVGV